LTLKQNRKINRKRIIDQILQTKLKFEDTKGVIRSRYLEDRQFNAILLKKD